MSISETGEMQRKQKSVKWQEVEWGKNVLKEKQKPI